mmetsp:Transcript_91004/g.262172  ORF Transcript_91004/g.262172 Transcript_91004/m.262172 type:complete len:247 (+) Transcript_91004:1-741(+)
MFSKMILGKEVRAFQWAGLVTSTAGVALVGLGHLLDVRAAPEGSLGQTVFGITLVVTGMALQSAQIIAEESLIKKTGIAPMRVVGLQGVWGLAVMVCGVYPVMYCAPGDDEGKMTNIVNEAYMLTQSSEVFWTALACALVAGSMKATGTGVTAVLSGVHRKLLDALRTALIWCFGLFVNYAVNPSSEFGEVWTGRSWLALGGFVLIVVGQLAYGGIFRATPPRELAPAPPAPAGSPEQPVPMAGQP